MHIEEYTDSDLLITAFEAGSVEIGGTTWHDPLWIGDSAVTALAWHPESADEHTFAAALAGKPELVLVGTGARQIFLPPRVVAALAGAGIGVEVMTTAAACRTFNILKQEHRRVWAWLIP